MRHFFLTVSGAAILSFSPAASASTETRDEYLSRLKEICEVECMQPRQFQRTARKRGSNQTRDMALIMDVKSVRRVGGKIQLHNINLETSHFEVLEALGSAGINTSQRNGIGGLPSGQKQRTNPNIVVIELDQQTLFDLLNPILPVREGGGRSADGVGIIVDGDRDREVTMPSLAALEAAILNRRIVVRGKPRLEVGIVGGRQDFRRKQAFLEVDNAAEMIVLPRFNKDGEAIYGGEYKRAGALEK